MLDTFKSKGPDQMGFLSGQNLRQNQLTNLQQLSVETPPHEQHVTHLLNDTEKENIHKEEKTNIKRR